MAEAFLRTYGDIPLEFAQHLVDFRGLAADASYRSGATNHERFFELRELAAEAQYESGAINHDTLMQFHGLPEIALYESGATAHDVQGYPADSPYVCPEEGTGVITNYYL